MNAREVYERKAAEIPANATVPPASAVAGREGYGWIKFDRLPNTRDLGGLPAADGKHVKRGLLLRSGTLGFASEADLVRLRDDYNLQLVVDLRGNDELAELPDPMDAFPQARYVHANILTEEAIGIVQSEEARYQARLRAAEEEADRAYFLSLLYPHLLLEKAGIEGYRLFLQSVLACEEGAALWHCYVGRDRCGMASTLMEAALGVSRKNMEEDYLATNAYAPYDLTEEAPAGMLSFNAAADAVERELGGFMGYINTCLGITSGEVADLRTRYLA